MSSLRFSSRREFLSGAALLVGCALFAGRREATRHGPVLRALEFLGRHQSEDGAWRSNRYGAFRKGDALTPLVLWALSQSKVAKQSAPEFGRGLQWLREFAAQQSRREPTWEGMEYPLFTAAYAAQTLAHAGEMGVAQFWGSVVGQLRISKELGWPEADPSCGAWSDAAFPPLRPEGATVLPDMVAPNISATILGLQAMAAAHRDAAPAEARRFIACCQNFSAKRDAAFDDGGFFFAANDPVRNKAGVSGTDANGQARYRSYGSATCDGILALKTCGVRRDAPEMIAAIDWLRRNAAGAAHSGEWPPDREDARESLLYYHAQAYAGALEYAAQSATTAQWAREQRARLISDLIERQDADGGWRGTCPDSFEDEPLVATAFALRALLPAT